MKIFQSFKFSISLGILFALLTTSLWAQSATELEYIQVWQKYTTHLHRLILNPSNYRDLKDKIRNEIREIIDQLHVRNDIQLTNAFTGLTSDFILNETVTFMNEYKIYRSLSAVRPNFRIRKQAYNAYLAASFTESLEKSVPVLRQLLTTYINALANQVEPYVINLQLDEADANFELSLSTAASIASLLFNATQ